MWIKIRAAEVEFDVWPEETSQCQRLYDSYGKGIVQVSLQYTPYISNRQQVPLGYARPLALFLNHDRSMQALQHSKC